MKRSFVCKNKDGSSVELEIEKFAVIKSKKAPVICIEQTNSGKYRLYVNEDFNVSEIESISIVRED